MCSVENRRAWKDSTPHLMVWHHIDTTCNVGDTQSLFVPWNRTIVVYCTAVLSCMPLHPTVGVRRRSPSEPHNACVLQSSDSGHAGAADWNSRSEEFARQISFLHESLGLSEEASRSWSRHSSQVPSSVWRVSSQSEVTQQGFWLGAGLVRSKYQSWGDEARSKGGHSEELCKSGAKAVQKLVVKVWYWN